MNKTRQTMIRKYGSEELWKAHLREIASKGGKATSGYPFAHGKVDPVKAGKMKKRVKIG